MPSSTPHRLSFLLAGLGLLAAFAAPARAEVIDIDNAELARLMQQGVPLVDIRTAPEWQDTGVIAHSRLLTFFAARGETDPPRWLASAAGFAGPQQALILICRSGSRSRAAADYLSQRAGYAKVYNVKLGIKGWLAAGQPVLPAERGILCQPGSRC